jgi:hypothetical protein
MAKKMGEKRRKRPGRKKGEKYSKMPQVEFDMDAIKEIKKRKKRPTQRR